MFNEEARRALMRGVNTLADAVKVTRGPKGRPRRRRSRKGSVRAAASRSCAAQHLGRQQEIPRNILPRLEL